MVKLRRPTRRWLIYRGNRYPNNIERLGVQHTYWGDLYHILLTLPWAAFIALVSFSYLAVNGLFAVAYSFDAGAIANAQGSLQELFFFSVQTMASIGYGDLHPTSVYTNWLVVIEAIFGLFFIATTTGLVFARFSLPSARIAFSNVAVVAPFNGTPTLMFRTANERHNYILEAQLWVSLVRDEITDEGDYIRRFHDLELVRSHSPVFSLSWTAMHALGEESPLYGHTAETIRRDNVEIIVTLTGLDETLSQTIHARHAFKAHEIYWDHKFADILYTRPTGQRVVDYSHFNSVEPLNAPKIQVAVLNEQEVFEPHEQGQNHGIVK